jgi:hypothetical protein
VNEGVCLLLFATFFLVLEEKLKEREKVEGEETLEPELKACE